MSKKKGVSAEEKRTRMLQIFYEKKDFFQLKELEKIAPKEKGIIAQSVKDVVQSLVDDGLVDTDKIGTSVYFWAYPSKAKNLKQTQLSGILEKIADTTKKLENSKSNLDAAKVGKEESDGRTSILKEIEEVTAKKEKLLKEIQKYKDCDPAVLEEMKVDTTKAQEAANRWTDNIFAIKSWTKNKFSVEGDVIDKQFGIPPELDYV